MSPKPTRYPRTADGQMYVRSSTLSPLKFFALSAMFVAGGVWMVVDPSPGGRIKSAEAVRVFGWFAIVFFGGGALLMLVQWLRAGRPSDVTAARTVLAERRRVRRGLGPTRHH
ncbi:MAG: hypothetical protein ABMA25_14120 [Ilumatobacteraceae bacterium]